MDGGSGGWVSRCATDTCARVEVDLDSSEQRKRSGAVSLFTRRPSTMMLRAHGCHACGCVRRTRLEQIADIEEQRRVAFDDSTRRHTHTATRTESFPSDQRAPFIPLRCAAVAALFPALFLCRRLLHRAMGSKSSKNVGADPRCPYCAFPVTEPTQVGQSEEQQHSTAQRSTAHSEANGDAQPQPQACRSSFAQRAAMLVPDCDFGRIVFYLHTMPWSCAGPEANSSTGGWCRRVSLILFVLCRCSAIVCAQPGPRLWAAAVG